MKSIITILFVCMIIAGCQRNAEKDIVDATPRRGTGQIVEFTPDMPKARTIARTEDTSLQDAPDEDPVVMGLSEIDRTLYIKLSNALDENDLDSLLIAAGEVGPDSHRALREKTIEALAWFGEDMRALERLQMFIGDADEELAADAVRRVGENIDLIEDETKRNRFMESTFFQHYRNSAAIDMVCEKIKQVDMTPDVMEAIIRIQEVGGVLASQRVRDAYKFITDENYTTAERAREWVKENEE